MLRRDGWLRICSKDVKGGKGVLTSRDKDLKERD